MAIKRLVALVGLVAALAVSPAAAQDTKRAITQISGDLYRFQNNFHFSVFLVTDEGILVTDPINADAAAWLKAELKKRFDKPVRYLVYSHDHADHSSGGEVFADSAIVVGHENTRSAMVEENRPTAPPTLTFSDRMSITLGGKVVELIYVGRNHSDNSIVMHFPEERALFAVDFIPIKTLGYRNLGDSYHPDWIESLKRVEAMDFDILLPGHGPVGEKAHVALFREYMENLYAAVLAAARDGQSLDQMKTSIRLDKYKDWGQHDNWLPMNIEGVYQRIALQRRGN